MTATVLIADDEPNILISLEFLLKREGYDVKLARDGQEAIDAIVAHRPDLVLLDVMMPRKTGFDVCQEVRALESVKDTRILMLTAKNTERDTVRALDAGANDFVSKPFQPNELLARVRRLLLPAA